VTIPKQLREEYDLGPGDEVVWRAGEGGTVVRKPTGSGARGMLVTDDTPKHTGKEITERIREKRRDDR